jgi:hypothetical protein
MKNKRKTRRPPIDRSFLRAWVARMEADVPPVSDEAINQWAAEHLDGKNRRQREAAIVGPWLSFLSAGMRASMQRLMQKFGADHPQPN